MFSSDDKLSAIARSPYWLESSRPLVSLVFVAPMLLIYEGGLVLMGPQAMRNGADLWLRSLLDHVGFGQYLVLPLMTCCGLLAWHHLRRESWRFEWSVLSVMALESVVLGLVLLSLAHLQGALLTSLQVHLWRVSLSSPDSPERLLAFFGAGIYEELLFRMLLLPAAAAMFRSFGAHSRTSLVMAAITTSLLFAAAHYRFDFAIGSAHWCSTIGESFEWMSFLFRFSAGLFFSAVFLSRGFGITAGAHALYDILVFFS